MQFFEKFICKQVIRNDVSSKDKIYYEPVEIVRRRVEELKYVRGSDYIYLSDCYQCGRGVPFEPLKSYKLIRKCYFLNKLGRGCQDEPLDKIKASLACSIFRGHHQGYSDAMTMAFGIKLLRIESENGNIFAQEMLHSFNKTCTISAIIDNIFQTEKTIAEAIKYIFMFLQFKILVNTCWKIPKI